MDTDLKAARARLEATANGKHGTIAEHCDPTDRHTGAAGWLTSRVDSYHITAPGAEA